MLATIKTATSRAARDLAAAIRRPDGERSFHSDAYLRHNARRLEHLASLRLPLGGTTVLEVGAGIGDHSHFYLDRGCRVTITDARPDNLRHLRRRYPGSEVLHLDLDAPRDVEGAPFDVVHCYGLLYHLSKPAEALSFLGRSTSRMLLMETCVSFGDGESVNLVGERRSDPTQSYSGTGCRPTRGWVFAELRRLFEHVYLPTTQPCHEEFPLDWTAPERHHASLQRAIFVASREPLHNDVLTPTLISQQTRQP